MAHWSEQKEKSGGYWQLKFMLAAYRFIGIVRLKRLIHAVVVVFYLVSPAARRVSFNFLQRVAERSGRPMPGNRAVYQHLYSFACSLLEKVSGWSGGMKLSELEVKTDEVWELVAQLTAKKGAVVLCSHMGNIELMRALAQMEVGPLLPDFAITSIVEFSGTAHFNRMLAEANPESMVRLVSANDMGPDTIIMLKDRISAGELVIIAGDRTAASNRGKTVKVSFLDHPAFFPQGAFVLASLMEAPVYCMFAVREDDLNSASRYGFYVWKSSVDFTGSRRERMAKIQVLVQEYVGHLEKLCTEHPYQWYNFFDFWKNPVTTAVH